MDWIGVINGVLKLLNNSCFDVLERAISCCN